MMFSCIFTFLTVFFQPSSITDFDLYRNHEINTTIEISDTLKYKYQYYVIDNIIISGNKITKPQIILRELLFNKDDTIISERLSDILEQSGKNLLNTSLFNFVTIDSSCSVDNKINILVKVIERWYVWPMPFFHLTDRNFNVWWETKDFSKADYGLYLTWDNFRGRKEILKSLVRFGYNESYGLLYKIPYINKKKTIGIEIAGNFSGNHEVPYITDNNKQIFFKDKEKYLKQNIFADFNITYRKNIFTTHIFQLNYNNFLFSDTLIKLNTSYSSKKQIQFFTFYYQLKCDHRDIKAYPLNGYYYDMEFVKNGFNLLKNENIYMSFIHTSLRKFGILYNRLYFAGGINAKLSNSAYQHYFLGRGLGFGNDFVRSYEYYVVEGQNYILLKSNLKFEVIPTRIKKIKFIPSQKFGMLFYALYFNAIADAAYVSNRQKTGNNNLSNSVLFGTGIGLDFVTYYDKVFRIEYTINKMGESNFFLHFVAPI